MYFIVSRQLHTSVTHKSYTAWNRPTAAQEADPLTPGQCCDSSYNIYIMQKPSVGITPPSSGEESAQVTRVKTVHQFLLHTERKDSRLVVSRVEVDGRQVFPGRTPKAHLQFKDLSDLETWLVRKIAPAAKVDVVEYPDHEPSPLKEEPVPEFMYNSTVNMQITKGKCTGNEVIIYMTN